MALHNETGKEGEELAAQWLIRNGFEILHRNWRYSRYEIDIIAAMSDTIHFVEVKTRRSLSYGLPEDQVSKSKLKQFIRAGAEYLSTSIPWKKVRYDILAVSIDNDDQEFLFIEDVYV